MTKVRGQRANIHVYKEILELCQVIDENGSAKSDEPDIKFIPFGELFDIYNYISNKCVGLLLRARKFQYVHFNGEMLYQRRDDDEPIILLKPIKVIRKEIKEIMNEIKANVHSDPKPTNCLK